MLPLFFTNLRAWLDRHERAEPDEVAGCHAGELPNVDLTTVPQRVPLPEDLTPLAKLKQAATVSRDFRAAGKGAQWDRVREYPTKVYGWPKNKQRGQARGRLEWDKITTIVLHTAGVNGLHPDRWLGVPCHAAVANDATVVLCHELDAYLWAAHAANRFSCSIEIAGDKAITDAQIEPARALVRYFVEELRAHQSPGPDGKPRPLYLIPHRFSHRSRVLDCGAQIWREVGEWALAQEDLGLQLGSPVGSGRGLPWPEPKG